MPNFYGTSGNDTLSGTTGSDVIDGGAGADSMRGLTGDDVYWVDDVGDVVIENLDGGIDTVNTTLSQYALPDNVEILQYWGPSTQDFTGIGNELNNAIVGWDGNDTLDGGAGADVMYGYGGNDVYYVDDVGDVVSEQVGQGADTIAVYLASYSLPDNVEGLVYIGNQFSSFTGIGNPLANYIEGWDGDDTLAGGAGGDTIYGLGGDDLLQGGAGDDFIDGGDGTDTVTYVDASGWVGVDLSQGFTSGSAGADTLVNVEDVIGSDFDDGLYGNASANILYGGSGHDTLMGYAGNDRLSSGSGDDYLNGGTGDNLLDGGAGFDRVSYGYSTSGVTVDLRIQGVAQDTGQGADTLIGIESASGTMYDDVLTGDDSANWLWGGGDGTGFAGNDTIYARGGDDLVEVGAGNHTLSGGGGNDTLSLYGNSTGIDAAGVAFSLNLQGSAQDTRQGQMTASGFENLSGSIYNDELSGNGGSNVIAGDLGSDTLNGGAGDDVLYGDGYIGVDTHGVGTSGPIVTVSDVASDGVGAGNDILDGGTGADQMYGGFGNDIYYVDNVGDQVVEHSGEGDDTVYSSTTYTLGGNVENLCLLGGANINAIGNAGNNGLFGNSGNNTLNGDAGRDILDGGAGTDTMRGGSGNDTYYVDAANDKVIENTAQGTDTVFSSVNYKLSSNVENLTLTGSAANGVGNGLANHLDGNSSANVLNGGRGADVMSGGGGNDRYFVDNVGDSVVESGGGGIDEVNSTVSFTLSGNVEKLLLRGSSLVNATGNGLDNAVHGNSGANVLTGLGGDDSLVGGGGGDTLVGGTGRDLLIGGNGADKFVFNDGDFGALTRSGCDDIRDFSHSQGDKIDLTAVDANAMADGDQAFAFIGTDAFHNVAGELRYDVVNGNTYVYGDTDGDGAADFMIRVDGSHALALTDFGI